MQKDAKEKILIHSHVWTAPEESLTWTWMHFLLPLNF